jgi:hypothetical protein
MFINFFKKLHNILLSFKNKTTKINNTEPLNKVSIILLILVDLFVIFNVFTGLSQASQSVANTYDIFPCQNDFYYYNENPNPKTIYSFNIYNPQKRYEKRSATLPFDIDSTCLEYNTKFLAIENNGSLMGLVRKNSQLSDEINTNQSKIYTLQNQYDSTLLDKIANQSQDKSLNQSTAETVKNDLSKLQKTNQNLEVQKNETINIFSQKQEIVDLNNYIQKEKVNLKNKIDSYLFWYPIYIFGIQLLFLIPLLAVAIIWHIKSVKENRGLQALISWHLFAILLIPIVFKAFEYLQFGNLFGYLLEFVVTLFGGLIVFGTYLLIVIVPLLGFAIIKFLQKVMFNEVKQSVSRVQKSKCVHCARKLRLDDEYCPFCGTSQYHICTNCSVKTYKYLSYCKHCGDCQK